MRYLVLICKVTEPIKGGTIKIPLSKSILHRILIAKFLAGTNLPFTDENTDVLNTYNILSNFNDNDFFIYDSGSTLRLLIPLLVHFKKQFTITLGPKLATRPLDEYYKIFQKENTVFNISNNKLTVSSKITPGTYNISTAKSSQFLSGLLFILPILNSDSTIFIDDDSALEYVNITISVLNKFGITIRYKNKCYFIQGNQKFKDASIETDGDWSGACNLIVAGMLGQGITIQNLQSNTVQGDFKFLDTLEAFGLKYSFNEGLTVYPSSIFSPFNININHIIDQGPLLFCLASVIPGTHTFTGINRLIYKESDRLLNTLDNLNKLKAKYSLQKDKLIIYGKHYLNNGLINSFNDHRMVMAFCAIKTKIRGDLYIQNYHCVEKSYPNYFNDFYALGGKIILNSNDDYLFYLRKKISLLDKRLAKLINERFTIVKEIGDYKKTFNLEVYDAKREQIIYQNLENLYLQYINEIKTVYQEILKLSKELQK